MWGRLCGVGWKKYIITDETSVSIINQYLSRIK